MAGYTDILLTEDTGVPRQLPLNSHQVLGPVFYPAPHLPPVTIPRVLILNHPTYCGRQLSAEVQRLYAPPRCSELPRWLWW